MTSMSTFKIIIMIISFNHLSFHCIDLKNVVLKIDFVSCFSCHSHSHSDFGNVMSKGPG